MKNSKVTMPPHGQLLLPLLSTLGQTGPKQAKAVCESLAEGLNIHPDIREAMGKDTLGRTFNQFNRRVRWVKQTADQLGLIHTPERGIWALTDKGKEIAGKSGKDDLGTIEKGTVVTLFSTPNGKFLWGYAEDVAKRIEPGSVRLLLTSPPYPLMRKKQYGNLNGENYLDWLEDILGRHLDCLMPNGAMLINLGEAYQQSGSPELSTYREELIIRAKKNLGLRLFGKYYWQNPCKPPAGYWVTHAKCRPKNDTEEILWLARENPEFHGQEIRTPYSPSMLRDLKNGPDTRKARPSGHGNAKAGFAVDHGGAWPGQLLRFPNADSQSQYFQFCKKQELPAHPARFPKELAEHLITGHSETGELICDPFGGSGTTAAAAEKLNRKWVSGDRELVYALGAIGRFNHLLKK